MRPVETALKIERAQPAPEYFIRFTVGQRIEHIVIMLTFIGLTVTGLPQKFNDASLSVWVVNNLGGIDNVRFLHRVLACSLMAASFYHLAKIGWTISRGRFTPSMIPTPKDFMDVLQMLRYSVGLTSTKPLFDRYDYSEKFEYWGIVYGNMIMIATGLVLWFPTYVTRVLPGELIILDPGELIPAAKEMHTGEALLALLVILVWHLYSVMLSPAHFPLNTSMFTGKISKHDLMEEHPLEYMRLTGATLEEVRSGESHPVESSSQRNLDPPTEEEDRRRPPSDG